MTDKTKLSPNQVREIIDHHKLLSRALHSLYLEVDASIAESIEVIVGESLDLQRQEAAEEERKRIVNKLAEPEIMAVMLKLIAQAISSTLKLRLKYD